jgi:GNAT superfamily N-acetyltransferase
MNDSLVQIRTWLFQEYEDTGKGFFCHWDMIVKAFEEARIILILDNNLVVGFLVFRVSDLVMDIKLAEIKPSHRGFGWGRKLIEKSFSILKAKGIVVAELFCSPQESEPFWKKLGFINFPVFGNTKKIRMYKPLIPTLERSKTNENDETISLWNVGQHLAEKSWPKWEWKLKFRPNSKELDKPIIHPAESEWRVVHKSNVVNLKDDIIKHFDYNCCEYDDFLIIKSIE